MSGVYLYADVFRSDTEFYEPKDLSFQTQIQLDEVSEQMGVRDLHTGIYPPSRNLPPQNYFNLISGTPPSIAVIDINNDGFMDFYVTHPGLGEKNKLYINQRGESFTEAADEYGIGDINQNYFSEVALFSDVNGDGWPDLILIRDGCHSLYLNQYPEKKFKELTNAFGGYCSNSRGFSLLDFNKDGKRDIFIGNYFAPVNLNEEYPPWPFDFPRGDDTYGDKNYLFKGLGDGHFEKTSAFDFPYKNHTFFPGIGDFNKDGWPDIFEGNDFSFDRLYYNEDGHYKEVTATDLPMNRHGFAGMNSEIFDFDRDGWLDIYVTNIFGPPFSRSGNILWHGGPHGFTDVSDELGVRKCGFSWGAKFVDLDLDGREELLVSGGMVRAEGVRGPQDGNLFWYRIGQRLATPQFLRGQLFEMQNSEKINYFGYQRGCLFQWNEKTQRYADVAPEAGFNRFDNSRALALIDIDNDGYVDFITGNYNDYLRIFKNKTGANNNTAKNNWAGFELRTTEKSFDPPLGARVRIYRGNNKKTDKLVFYREIYPANGHRGQNDPRLVIGLGDAQKDKVENIGVLEVKWPDDSIEIFKDSEINKYNLIIKGRGQIAQKEI